MEEPSKPHTALAYGLKPPVDPASSVVGGSMPAFSKIPIAVDYGSVEHFFREVRLQLYVFPLRFFFPRFIIHCHDRVKLSFPLREWLSSGSHIVIIFDKNGEEATNAVIQYKSLDDIPIDQRRPMPTPLRNPKFSPPAIVKVILSSIKLWKLECMDCLKKKKKKKKNRLL
jgi:hypothetical protein